jgi:anhydro-N-acetylmuramic acid kinase
LEKKGKMLVLGVMSGTSLDGLDLALCELDHQGKEYTYKILKSATIPYSSDQKRKLGEIKNGTAVQYFAMNHLYGKFISQEINKFILNTDRPDLISSHGHTIFHQPQLGFTKQIGCGATIAAQTGITTVCDFRSLDVVNGGQGAPLVPVGDQMLFGNYDACLNLGGIANISFEKGGKRKAFDVCFVNMALNYLAELIDKPYDDEGKIARSGKCDDFLLKELKSTLQIENRVALARERYENLLLPIMGRHRISIEDKLCTFCIYAADSIAAVLNENSLKKVFVTGGGAYNKFLIDRIGDKFSGEIIIPDDTTIQFKEALIFAFLGYLRVNEKVNSLHSVTGAKSDTVGGAVYYFKKSTW